MNTKPLDIFGIGNALVDTTIETSDSEIQALGLKKGQMQLIDDTRLLELLHAFRGTQHERASGGSAANTLITAQGLGLNCAYACKVADDENGRFFINDMKTLGVQLSLDPQNLESGTTGICLVNVTPDAERTMSTYLGTTADFSSTEIDFTQLQAAKLLYIEGYLMPSPSGLEAAQQAHHYAIKHKIQTALTLSDLSMVTYFKSELNSLISYQGVDVLFCNEEEAKHFTECDTPEAAINALSEKARLIAMTRGSKGAWIMKDKTLYTIPAIETKAIDTNGAGDAFAGAFLAGIFQGLSLEKAGKLANSVAAKVVSQYGPRLSKKTLRDCCNIPTFGSVVRH